MKCPKCSYLGFETGDRCKNCGYDFSLLTARTEPADPDLAMHVPDEMPAGADVSWMDRLHSSEEEMVEAHEMPEAVVSNPPTVTPDPIPEPRPESTFALFSSEREDDDEPLIRFPAPPRAPLSVRRTPEQPRLRPSARSSSSEGRAFSLEFADTETLEQNPFPVDVIDVVESPVGAATHVEACSLARRAVAGLTDHAILFGIDLIVIYSTLRMAALNMEDWRLLPAAPMLAFLLLLKLSYFGAFTAACGQTIGKMATQIRVVSDEATLDPSRAIRRTLVAAVSLLAFGAGFIPALLDPDHRALHDRLARTRVVDLPSA